MIKKILAISLLLGSFAYGGEPAPESTVATVPTALWAVPVQPDVYRAALGTRLRWWHQDKMARIAASRIVVPRVVQPIAVQPIAVTPIAVQPIVVQPAIRYVPLSYRIVPAVCINCQ